MLSRRQLVTMPSARSGMGRFLITLMLGAPIVFGLLFAVESATLAEAKNQGQSQGTNVVTWDGRFIAYDNGTVKDTKTGLMWAAKDNGKDINWHDAKQYCENYRGGGYTDWRMPTQDELAGLYDNSESYQVTQGTYNVHLTPLIQLSACCPWASNTRGSSAAVFDFSGGGRLWYLPSRSVHRRALPVRGGN